MPDEHSTIEQLLDEAMPILDAARDFPERNLTYEERGYTGSVLDYILRWDNPEWRARRGLLFEPLSDDPPLILAVKATILAINNHLQPPRNKNVDGVRRLASFALAAITVYRNPVPVQPPAPEPEGGMFPADINPLVAIETGPEREPEEPEEPEAVQAPDVPVFEPYVAMRQFHIGGSQSINVPAGSILWIDTTRGLFRFNTPMSVTTYDGSRLPGAIRARWLLPAEEAQRQERPLDRQIVPMGLSDEAYERALTLLSMPEMSREGTRRELLRILETPVDQEPQRRVPFILSHGSTDRLIALITMGIHPVPGDDMMDFIETPIPGTYPRQEPSEQEPMRLLFETPIPVPPSLQREGVSMGSEAQRPLRPPPIMTRYRVERTFVTQVFDIPTTNARPQRGEELWWDGMDRGIYRGISFGGARLMDAYVERLIEPWPAGVDPPKKEEPKKTSWQHILEDGDDP